MTNNRCKAVSPKDRYCFFGYYDKCPWDEKEEYFLFHQVSFQDRPPQKGDKALICLLELKTMKISILGETHAWNFQQGAMLQWLPGRRIIYNDREEDRFVSRILDLGSGKERIIPRAVSAVSPNGKYALSLNFSRIAKWRPGYGYEGLKDKYENDRWPENDGVYFVDLETGKYRLIITFAQALDFRKDRNIRKYFSYFNHTFFSRDSKRFLVLNLWLEGKNRKERCLTSDLEGKEIYDLIDSYLISHYDWKNASELIIWTEINEQGGFWLVEDRTKNYRLVSEKMQKDDGHCSYSKDEKLILLDSYTVENYRPLSIFDTEKEKEILLGKFYCAPQIFQRGELRCDLHPRWSRSERFVSFDSIHEGYRRVYVMELERE